ncbi:MAG: hypothetical protein AYP45_16320 [Candidatus Brocadia carolinensis]|uniref:SMP-30/Gluconolactonase/LRE-like region domain-containing protein n=1 Tax=Candidatus Brocadia carolinensis TaxID=1004156 RepID=A0A1V4APX7_9BACT|nr:MAG: hypothetical protein AYP45_16320 [Candidatus Brocadia caroliniensis]
MFRFNRGRVNQHRELDYPPENIAVSPEGRVFFCFLPAGKVTIHASELVPDTVVPYPARIAKEGKFTSSLSLRIGRQNRLWILDYGTHGFHHARMYAFDLSSNQLVHEFAFPRKIRIWM